jgi:hypothetical protein
LGTLFTEYGNEIVLGRGKGISQFSPDKSGYIVLHVQLKYADDNITVTKFQISSNVTGVSKNDHLEYRFQQVTSTGAILPLTEWLSQDQLGQTINLTVPANTGYLNVQVRSVVEGGISETFHPLTKGQDYAENVLTELSENNHFSQTQTQHHLVHINSTLTGIRLDSHLQTPPWGIENYQDGSLLWLGHGESEGLGGILWSTQPYLVQVTFKVEPGPARPDRERTVELSLTNATGTHNVRQQFDQPTDLTFTGELQPGPNNFSFFVLDEPTIAQQPDGETRPLLVLLRHITIEPIQ